MRALVFRGMLTIWLGCLFLMAAEIGTIPNVLAEPAAASTREKYPLPAGAKFAPQTEVKRRFGLTPEEAYKKLPKFESMIWKLDGGWNLIWWDENKIIKLRSKREFLILSGRLGGPCGGVRSAVIYDIKKRSVALATYEGEEDEYHEIPLNPPADSSLFYKSGAITPKFDAFAILWNSLRAIRAVGDYSWHCDPEASDPDFVSEDGFQDE